MISLIPLKRKKEKKAAKKKAVAVEEAVPEEGAAAPAEAPSAEYSYVELLERAFNQIKALSPGEKQKTTLPIPILTRGGPRKTIWANFKQTCDILQRSTEHFQSFLSAELGSDASMDASFQLIIRGKYTAKQAETILKNYIQEYVACSMCHSANTTLSKDNVTRLVFIDCAACGSKRSVSHIKSGFHATTKADRKAQKKL